MNQINRFSSLRQPLDKAYLADRLKNAKSYKRIAGYFRSSILELVGEEIENIGDVRIVCNSDLDPHDIVVSKAAREVALKEKWNQIPIETEALLYRECYQRLYKLLVNGKIQIKVVAKDKVFVHGKAGVITMNDDTRTSFLGSVNESRSAFSSNYEILWEDNTKDACDWVEEEFDALWEIGHDLPDSIISEIKRISERYEIGFNDIKNPMDMPAASMSESPIYRGGEQLQPWQRTFVLTFLLHRKIYGKARLLIADEVGLGKTLSMATAALISNLLDDGPVLIFCPATLTFQWQTELKDRLGIPSAVWVSNQKHWVDPDGRIILTRGAEDIVRCPYQIAIVSTGLIVHGSQESQILRNARVGTLILDEAHKARVRSGLGKTPEDNNLLAFMKDAAKNATHVILGTATPIQIAVRELWDLMLILNQSADFVLGREYSSRWINWELTHPIITGSAVTETEEEAWDLIRSPLVARVAPMMDVEYASLIASIRNDLNIPSTQFFSSEPVSSLNNMTRSFDLPSAIGSNLFKRNNPFVRHVVLRRRKSLEEKGLLEPVGVDIHPKPNARFGVYSGVVFDGLGLMTNHPFELAYEAAEQFVDELSKRTKSAKLLKSIFLQRICSSFASGRLTAQRMLDKQVKCEEDGIPDELELGVLRTLTEQEMEYLLVVRNELSRLEAVDPKLNAVKWFLSHFETGGKRWIDHGCIIFSQYYDTANWVAYELSKDFPDHIVAVYAGTDKSGIYKGQDFVSIKRDRIKSMVKTGEIKLVVATDAACEGLNLQTLGTLINIDLPWNPSRLEQRLGRIKRFGQARDSVDMLNLTYHQTRDEDVYSKISERMKDRFDIFGGLPDCIDDDWIEDIEEFEEMAETHLHMRAMVSNIFEEKWGATITTDVPRWEDCSQVLSRSDIEKKVSIPWK